MNVNKGGRPGPLDSPTAPVRGRHVLLPRCSQRRPRRLRGPQSRGPKPGGSEPARGHGRGTATGRGPQAGQGCGSGSEGRQAAGGGRPDRGPTSTLLPCGLPPSGAAKPGGRPTEGSHPHSWDLGLFGARPPQPGVHHHPARPLPSPGHPPTARAPLGLLHGGLSQLDQAGPRRAEPGPQSPAVQRLAEAALPEDSLAGNTGGQSCPGPRRGVWLWVDHTPSQSLGVPSGHWGDGRRPLRPRELLQPRGPAAGPQPLCPSQHAGPACPWRTRQQESGQSLEVARAGRPARPLHAEPRFPHL